MKNPFTPGSGLDPPYLAGRDVEIDGFSQMLHHIRDGHVENLMIYGIRGVGKTVLMNQFVKICAAENFLPVTQFQYSEQYANPKEFIRIFKHDLDDSIETFSKMEKTKGRIQSAAKYLKPANIGMPGVVSYEPSYDLNDKIPLMHHIIDYMDKKWSVIKNGNYAGVVFLFDEFHTVYDIKEKRYTLADFIGAINEIQKKGHPYSAVLCGLPTLSINLKAARSYSERMFKTLEISNLDEVDAIKAITKPLEKTDWSFSDDLISAIVQDTDRYPYFIQFYSKEIINLVGKKDIGLDDYTAIKDSILEKLGRDFFDQRMESLSDLQKKLLHTMAKLEKTDMVFSLIHKSANITKGTLGKNLRRLENKGIVYKQAHGIYRFSIPLFRTYLLAKTQSQNIV